MLRIGIDLGGTNIVAGVVDEKYNIIASAKTKTSLPRSAESIADSMAEITKLACSNAGISLDDIISIGIGSPGIVDTENGTVAYSNNLGFYDVKLQSLMEQRLNKKCRLSNDANAAAYGEYLAGSGKGTDNFILLTLGTGIGGGIILNGKLFTGSSFAGGELGHIMLLHNGEKCTCGRRGCFEQYASATALIRQTKSAMLSDKLSAMWQICDNNIENVNGKTAFDGALSGDKTAQEVVKLYTEYLSAGIVDIINIFLPDMICIGGGISAQGETLLANVRKIVYSEIYARSIPFKTKISTAVLGNDAGIVGAAFL